MSLGSGWDQLYDTGLTPGEHKSAWDQGGINYITLGWHQVCWNEPWIRVRSIISHWVDTWNAEVSLGLGWDQLYHTGLTPGVLEWDWDQGKFTFITPRWHLEYCNQPGIRVGSLISHWVDTWNAEMSLGSGWDQLYHTGLTPGSSAEMSLGLVWDQLYHTGLTPGVLKWAWDEGGINYITLGWHLECWNEPGIRVASIISIASYCTHTSHVCSRV